MSPLGRNVAGGILIEHATAYDRITRLLLGTLFRSFAKNVVASVPPPARVLEVGCGPGHLANKLAETPGLEVTGLDLDPNMIERARANAARTPGIAGHGGRAPTYVVGDVASLPFEPASFDLVVSTFSMHHWSDPAAGLAEIGRVLRPGGRVLIWDFGAGSAPLHSHTPDPTEHVDHSPLELVGVTPWRWPWRFSLCQRLELVRR
jgi:ubiquinone/menaquinone biosynthesis C-methylase UbiE